MEDRHALTALAAHAVVDDPVRARLPPAARGLLAGGVAVGVVQAGPAAADVVEAALDVGQVAAHLQRRGRLARVTQEIAAVEYGFGDRGLALAGGVVHAPGAVREARAAGAGVGEGGHDRGGAGAADAALGRHQRQFAQLLAQARVGQALQLEQRVQVPGRGDAVEQAHRREAAGDDAPAWCPRHPRAPRRRGGVHPRWASRYWRTTYRSATWPPSMRSSALSPPNSGASLGRLIQASAWAGSANRTCSDFQMPSR